MFSSRRRSQNTGRLLLGFCAFIAVLLFIVYAQFDRFQLAALAAVGIFPTSTPFASTLATDATALYAKGDVQGAAALLERAVAQQPNNVNYMYEYGKVLYDLDRSSEVSALGDRAIAIAPNDPRGYALKATALMWSEPTTAIPIATRGLETNPNFAPLYSALAISYTNIGRYVEGFERARRAVQLDPLDVGAYRAYSWTLIYVGRYEEAIEALETALRINPYLTSLYFELASYYRIQAINQPAMAIAIYFRILELEPRNAKAYLRLCDTYSALGQFSQAQPYCQSALDIDPTYGAAWRGLGQVQYPRRNYEGSIDSFRKCVENGSIEIECWYLRGLAHYALGQCEQAWDVLQESLTRATAQGVQDSIINTINIGLYNITQRCAGFVGRALPTEIPPTTIPPTPIGGGT